MAYYRETRWWLGNWYLVLRVYEDGEVTLHMEKRT